MVRLLKPDRPRVPNYFSRREQWRLLMLVAALGLVVFVMREVRRPENVAKVAQAFSEADSVGKAGAAVATEKKPAPVANERTDTKEQPSGPRQSALPAEALATIRDNTHFRTAEKDAWFDLIGILQRTPPKELAAQSVGDVGYVQLAQQPGVYRGQVVTVRGTVRQVTEEQPAANALGIDSYYRLVMQPSGGEIWPIFVYCLTLPADFPRGEKIAVDITATGFFFKNLSYQWQNGLGIAPVVLAKEVTRIDAASAPQSPTTAPRAPTVSDTWNESNATAQAPAEVAKADLSEVLSLAGWDADRFAKFADDGPLTQEQRQELIQLLWRVRTFDTASIAAWTEKDVSAASLKANPDEYRGRFVRFSGRVQRVAMHELSAADAERLEIPRYYECELALDGNSGNVTVLTPRVPQEWLKAKTLDEPATVAGLFIKRLPASGDIPTFLVVAQQLAGDSFGRSVLTTLGMDVGLLDAVRNHRGILGSEREAFYQLLAAVSNVGANQLIRFAEQNLDQLAASWSAELNSPDAARRALAQEVVRRAKEGRYSVAPLFNDADRQVGQLIVVDGMARRIVRVDTSAGADGGANEVARRLGIDHYYEMEVFTDDSQHRPLVFCVRDLPPGMPTGGDLREPVRVAGFFFKSWRYRTRDAGHAGDAVGKVDALGKLLIAPLLIGRGPVRLELEEGAGHAAELIGGGLFVAALAGIWAAAWWFARGDRRFRERTPAAGFSLPAGESLDELHVPAVETPMKIAGDGASDTRNSS